MDTGVVIVWYLSGCTGKFLRSALVLNLFAVDGLLLAVDGMHGIVNSACANKHYTGHDVLCRWMIPTELLTIAIRNEVIT